MNILKQTLDDAMASAMADPKIRLLLWHIVSAELWVFEPGYNHNATAYSLLAKKEAGLKLLSWMKRVNPQGVFVAESDYELLAEQTEQEGGGNG